MSLCPLCPFPSAAGPSGLCHAHLGLPVAPSYPERGYAREGCDAVDIPHGCGGPYCQMGSRR